MKLLPDFADCKLGLQLALQLYRPCLKKEVFESVLIMVLKPSSAY